MFPPPNTPVSSPKTYVEQTKVQEEPYCPIQDIVHRINEMIRAQWEMFDQVAHASMEYLLTIETRKFKRLK